MAGVKISKMLKYEELFDGQTLPEDIENMILPISFGNKTISITIGTLIDLMEAINGNQQEQIDENAQKITENTELINTLSEQILEKIGELQENADAEHRRMIESQQIIDSGQDERIEDIENTNIWEIYGNE